MITKTTNLDDAYQALFDKVYEASDGAIDVHNLENFFGSITEIGQLDPKFLRLPLDEPLFEIDADTRKINIPDVFRTNGLSVQGDHLAETVFFSIDKYFDYMDLSLTNITINWKMGDKVGKTKSFIMSKDIIPGKIVFGWPVHNIITAKSGALTFAVEFNKVDDNGNITYNFNTLAATINIKDGLILNDNVEVTSLDEDVLSILADSVFGEGEAAVGDIVWTSGNGNGLVRGVLNQDENGVTLYNYKNPIMLQTIIDEDGSPKSLPITLFGQAYVDDGTVIKYTSAANASLPEVMLEVETRRELVEDRANLDEDKLYFDGAGATVNFEDIDDVDPLYTIADLDVNTIYFVKVGNSNPPAYKKATADDIAAWGTEDQIPLYIKMAKIDAIEDGSYIIKAQGVKLDKDGKKIGNGLVSASTPIIIPAVQTPDDIIITNNTEMNELEEGYSFIDNNSNIAFLMDGVVNLAARAEGIDELYSALRFDWQKKEAGVFSSIAQANYQIENNSALAITDPGEYRIAVTNYQNGKASNVINSAVYTVSALAGKITSAVPLFRIGSSDSFAPVTDTIRYNSKNGSLSRRSVTLKINNPVIEGARGTIEYEWYRLEGIDDAETRVLVPANANGELVITSGDGLFIPVVKNNYNGSVYTFELEPINIDDTAE